MYIRVVNVKFASELEAEAMLAFAEHELINKLPGILSVEVVRITNLHSVVINKFESQNLADESKEIIINKMKQNPNIKVDVFEGENGLLDLDFYVLKHNLKKAKVHFSQVKKMMKAFEHWFGPYPFYEDSFKIVEVPYLGMEHQSSITYGNRYMKGYLGRDLSKI